MKKLGGLSGKSHYISLAKKDSVEKNLATLLVDAGDIFFKHDRKNSPGSKSAQIGAAGIAQAYMLMGYEAIGLSARDLQAGKDFFQKKIPDSLPFVSCNAVTKELQPFFAPFLIKRLNGVNIGIIGLTGGSAPLQDFLLNDWQQALRQYLPSVREKVDVLLLLSSLDMDDNKEISTLFPEIDLIVSTSNNYGNTTKLLNKTLLVQVAGEGNMLGQLLVNWSPLAKEGWQELEADSTEELEKLLAASDKRVENLHQAMESMTDTKRQRRLHQRLLQESRTAHLLRSRLENIDATRTQLEQNRINSFTARFRKIYPKPGSQNVIDLVARIQAEQQRAAMSGR